jgi:hypothetical protein
MAVNDNVQAQNATEQTNNDNAQTESATGHER